MTDIKRKEGPDDDAGLDETEWDRIRDCIVEFGVAQGTPVPLDDFAAQLDLPPSTLREHWYDEGWVGDIAERREMRVLVLRAIRDLCQQQLEPPRDADAWIPTERILQAAQAFLDAAGLTDEDALAPSDGAPDDESLASRP